MPELPGPPRLTSIEKMTLDFFIKNPGAQLKDCARYIGRSYADVQKTVYNLMRKGLLIRIDRGRYVPNCLVIMGGSGEL